MKLLLKFLNGKTGKLNQCVGNLNIILELIQNPNKKPPIKLIHENIQKIYHLFPILKERAHQFAGTLSGGEQQMLAIGRGLMANPKIILLDEPSLGLAPLIVNQVYQLISAIRDSGITVLLVEQNAKKALSLCDKAYVLENGRITLTGTGKELLCSPAVKKAYLGE